MDVQAIVSALMQAGGYAVLCWFLIQQMQKQTDAHREEVAGLADVIRQNTAAIAGLTGKLGGAFDFGISSQEGNGTRFGPANS